MKTTKRSLLASGLAVLVCIAMLAGTTFAWFTDSVVNKGNKIESGKLLINATAYDLVGNDQEGFEIKNDIEGINGGNPFQFETKGQNLKTDTDPIINEVNWEPGQSSAKLLKVENAGTLATKIKLEFDVTDGGLMKALWFDFIQVDEEGNVKGQFGKRAMSELATFAQDLELPILEGGKPLQFILVYGMDEEAGNEYQGKTFSADVTILATQYTEEEDGFGSDQYDKDATYAVPVSTEEEFLDLADQGGEIKLIDDLNIVDNTEALFTKDTVIDMNGHTININGSIKATASTTLTVKGDGKVNGVLYADKNGNLVVNAGDDFTVNSPKDWAVYGALGSTITIDGGTYTSVQEGAGVIHALGNSLTMKNAVVNVGAESVYNSCGIYSNASSNVLENVTVNAQYSIAADFKNSYGKTTIRGGSFTTDKIAQDIPVNPTIRYQGLLDISDADITRVGTGILFSKSWPKPTGVENLICTDCTFHVAEGSTGYRDIDYNR